MLGAALGASIGVPAGMLHDYLVTMLPPEQQRERYMRIQQTEEIVAGQGTFFFRGETRVYIYIQQFDVYTMTILYTCSATGETVATTWVRSCRSSHSAVGRKFGGESDKETGVHDNRGFVADIVIRMVGKWMETKEKRIE